MAKCEVCGREGVTFRSTFGNSGIPALELCRVCNARLMLSIPKNATPMIVHQCIDKLFADAEANKKRNDHHQHHRR